MLNPFVWLHLRLTTSPRVTLAIPLVLAAVVLVASTTTISAVHKQDRLSVISTWLAIVSIGQGIILFILAPASIRKAVLRDAQTGMLESHRMSPLPSRTITYGYLLGPAIQALLLFAAILPFSLYFLIQMSLTGLTGTILTAWWVSLACVLALALMNAALVLLNALSSNGKGNVMAVAIIGATFGGLFIVKLVPGLSLIAGILSGSVLYSNLLGKGSSGDPTTVSVSMIVQLLIAGLCLIAASRKVRQPNQPAFTLPLAFCMVAVCGTALLLGIQLGKPVAWIAGGSDDHGEQVVATAWAFYLFALIPVLTAARQRSDAWRTAALSGATPPHALAIRDCVAPVAGLLTLAVLAGGARLRWVDTFFVPLADSWGPNLLIAVALLLAAWIDYQIAMGFALRGWRVGRGLVYSLIAFKAVPPLIDVIRWMFSDEIRQRLPPELYYAAGSPIGTMCLAYRDFNVAAAGLIVQIAVAVAATIFAGLSQRRAAREVSSGPAFSKGMKVLPAAPLASPNQDVSLK